MISVVSPVLQLHYGGMVLACNVVDYIEQTIVFIADMANSVVWYAACVSYKAR
jgi:hypothetical protein